MIVFTFIFWNHELVKSTDKSQKIQGPLPPNTEFSETGATIFSDTKERYVSGGR
jgi:hypothetical protein